MPEADVVYSDVKFTKTKGDAAGITSTPAEATYSEVRILKTDPSTELPESQQHAASNGGSKVTSERVVIAVLSALLAAAVIAFGFTYYINIQTTERLRRLTDEHETLRKNLTESHCEVKTCDTVLTPCPPPPVVSTIESCLKCEEGWEPHGDKCYYFSNNSLSWEEARRECCQRGGDLVKIDSREEQSFLQQKLGEKMTEDEDKFWIGLTDSQEEGKWLWVDGSPLSKSLMFWSRGEPDNWSGSYSDGENCVRMGERAGDPELKCWFDKFCKAPQKSICEKSAETGRPKCV